MKIMTEGNIPDYPAPYDDTAIKQAIADLDARLKKLEGGSTPAPVSNIWTTKMADNAPINVNSMAFVASVLSQSKMQIPTVNSSKFSTPIYVIKTAIPKVKVKVTSNSPSLNSRLAQGIMVPANAVAADGTDGHISFRNLVDDAIYGFWQFKKQVDGSYIANAGYYIEKASQSNWVCPKIANDWQTDTASGLPFQGGVSTLEEIKSGVIPHALAMAIPYCQGFVAPAWVNTDNNKGSQYPPYGLRLRLPVGYQPDSTWPPILKMLTIAARDYGIYLRDYAGVVALYLEDTKQYGVGEEAFTPYCGGWTDNWGTPTAYPAWYKIMPAFPFDKLVALA